MAQVETKGFAIFTSVGFACLIILRLYFVGDSRMSDGRVDVFLEMNPWEVALAVYGLVAVLTNIIAAARHAFSNGHIAWCWLNILVWPISFYYVWRVATQKSKNGVVT